MSERNLLSEELADALRAQLSAHGQKLFFVDENRAVFAHALCSLLKDEREFLLIVPDREQADSVAAVLSEAFENVRVFGSEEALFGSKTEHTGGCFVDLGMSGTLTQKTLLSYTDKFRRAYPRLVVALEHEGKPVLHRDLCIDQSESGSYASVEKHAKFCFSDLLAACRYPFVAVDGVYSVIDFQPADSLNKKAYQPTDYDLEIFMGTPYYCDKAHSYKRLKLLTDGAKTCLIRSDCIARRDVTELYACLNLLCERTSLVCAKQFLARLSPDYMSECDAILPDIINCKDDDAVVSTCQNLAKGVGQKIPLGIREMSKYLNLRLGFLSSEEIYCRILYGYALGCNINNFDSLMDRFNSDQNEIARGFRYLFFDDALKSELESAIFHTRLCDLSGEELSKLKECFAKYGYYHSYRRSGKIDRVRLWRDGSGFETFAMTGSDELGALDYVLIEEDGDFLYKSIAIARILDGRAKEAAPAELPALVLTDGAKDEVLKNLKGLLPARTVTDKLSAAAANDNAVIVCDFAAFEKTSEFLPVKTAVFFDILPDFSVFRSLLGKAMAAGDVHAFILSTQNGLSGRLADDWSDYFRPWSVAPVGGGEAKTVNGAVPLRTVYERLDGVYRRLRAVASGREKDEVSAQEIYNLFREISVEFSSDAPFSEEEAIEDLGFIQEIGDVFEDVFSSSVTIGKDGEETNAAQPVYGGEPVAKENCLLFNVCSLMLLRHCDTTKRSCNGCPEYERFFKNSFTAFRKSASKFFKRAVDFATVKAQATTDKVIRGSLDRDKWGEFLKKIEESALIAEETLETIAPKPTLKTLFAVPFGPVEKIRSLALEVYAELFAVYFNRLTDIFDAAVTQPVLQAGEIERA